MRTQEAVLMRKFFKRHKRKFAAVICIIIVIAMVLGPLAAVFQVF